MESITLARFNDLYDSYTKDNQAGVRKRRGSSDQVSQAAACDGNVYTIDHTRPIALPGTLPL